MIETIALVLVVLWLLGIVTGLTFSGLIYIFLVIACVLTLVSVVKPSR